MKRSISLQEHQDIIYDLLYTLDGFCQEHNVKYFLGYGSLLGAVRHGGIIPWDDDADLIVPRPEYERLKCLLFQNPIPGYLTYDIDYSKDYYYPFMKFGKINTLLLENEWHCTPKSMCINIDIFPIDGCPNDISMAKEFTKNVFSKNISYIRTWVVSNPFASCTSLVSFLRALKYSIPFFKKNMLKKTFSESQKYDYNTSLLCSNSSWAWYGERDVLQKSIFSKRILLKFGDRELYAPLNYENYLKTIYGDYMVLPPESKRVSTHKHGAVCVIE